MNMVSNALNKFYHNYSTDLYSVVIHHKYADLNLRIYKRRYVFTLLLNCTGGIMVSVLAWSVVDHGFEPRLGQTKDYYIGICYLSAKHAALRRRSRD